MARRSSINGSLHLKVTGDVVRRMTNIRALWLAVHNDPETICTQEIGAEFYSAVGDFLQGKTVDQITFHRINAASVKRHIKEG